MKRPKLSGEAFDQYLSEVVKNLPQVPRGAMKLKPRPIQEDDGYYEVPTCVGGQDQITWDK